MNNYLITGSNHPYKSTIKARSHWDAAILSPKLVRFSLDRKRSEQLPDGVRYFSRSGKTWVNVLELP